MIDRTKEMIVIKGEIKTSSIKSCVYNSFTKKWNVTFNEEKTYFYDYKNVEKLNSPIEINLNEYRLKNSYGQILGEVIKVYLFSDKAGKRKYYHVIFNDGSSEDYRDDEVSLVRSVFNSQRSKDLVDYFRKTIMFIDSKKNEFKGYLIKQYEKVDFGTEETAINLYINGKPPKKNKNHMLIFPFGCNSSQYEAVENALNNQMSVIQGPPGTGKTQTILNIIANLLISNKTIQVVSNNNSAIENVQEKLALPKYGMDFIVAKLGKKNNKKDFINNQSLDYPDFSGWEYKGNCSELLNEIIDLSQKLKLVYQNEKMIAKLTSEKADILVEKTHFDQYIKEKGVVLDSVKTRKKIRSTDIMHLLTILIDKSEREEQITFWQKLLYFFRYGLNNKRKFDPKLENTILVLKNLFYKMKIEEIDKEINRLNINNKGMNVSTDELAAKSMIYLKHYLAKRYARNVKRKIFSEDDLWKYPEEVLKEYPVTLSTTHSSITSLGNKRKKVQYDYLIMDEASQVDIATGVLSLSSSSNAVIVGDTKQLPNIVSDETMIETIFAEYDLSEGYLFSNSFLKSVMEIIPDIPITLLCEHYRCHPKIINFCNQKYYSDELVIMTHDNGEENVIKAITTVKGKHVDNNVNQRQIDVIKQEILPELGENLSDVGIITPYNNQVEAIKKQLPNIEVDTVHKFQGREKDIIIISTVDDEEREFSNKHDLINVAVSRAKKRLYVVASGNDIGKKDIYDLISYIRYNNCEVVESKVYSIFDYLYSNYTEARKKYLLGKKRVSEFDSENLMYNLIDEVLKELNRNDIAIVSHFPLSQLLRDLDKMTDEERKYAINPLTHLDFILYSKVSKECLGAIEVDGYTYHKEGTKQAERDLLKNSILEKYDIPFERFSTKESGEKERLIKFINKIS